MTGAQFVETGKVRAVHVIPSGDVAAAVLAVVPPDTVTKPPFPKLTECQVVELGKTRAVHVIPSGEVAATELRLATATKTPFPNVTVFQ